ncbi:DNA primase [Erythrobacter litoralis]|uniref:DNA primase n=1 Tax=Erythrobacter litoralis TaxID=39960 RepID=UPI002435EC35|nr:DNA primase [Erythrobacter litoralis]MDG6079587.1 DNA primase [Erythrobacter litoralis]
MALTPQWLDELRMRTTLSAVVGRSVRLTKAGREFKACCPFHQENTPSFYVNDEKGFYHCFGCEAHGDAIRWLTDQRGMPFMDAVKELAAEAGMEVPAPDPQAARRAEKRASLHDVTAAAQDWFMEKLRSRDGARAREYLAGRGFSDATMREFGFGYAPDSKQAMQRDLSRFDEAMLVESGMRIETDDGTHYDRFRDRLMLPIHDQRGRVIAFGGRILADRQGVAKYLNSPDTPLFDKGRTLYNLHRAAPAARAANRLIVVEGYMDAVALADAGIREVVAPLGTALTEAQIELLWRQVERPILCFDGDNAGQRAAMRAISRALPLLRPSHSLAIVRLPAGLDPDDLVKQKGVGALEALLEKPDSLLNALWTFEKNRAPLDSPEAKAGLKARLLEHIEAVQHPDIRSLYKRELLERFSSFAFPPRPPRDFSKPGKPPFGRFEAKSRSVDPRTRDRIKAAMAGGARDALLAGVIAGFLRFPEQIAAHESALSAFAARDPKAGPAIDSLLIAAETLDLQGHLPISPNEGLPALPETSFFAFLDEGTDPDEAREELAEAVSLLVERPALEAALAQATARFETDPEGAFAEQQRLLRKKLEFETRLGQMASRRAATKARQNSAAQGIGPADGMNMD